MVAHKQRLKNSYGKIMQIQINHSIKLNDGIIINNAIITMSNANDNYDQKVVAISVKLENQGVSLVRDVGLMPYDITWEDEDVQAFIEAWAENNRVS